MAIFEKKKTAEEIAAEARAEEMRKILAAAELKIAPPSPPELRRPEYQRFLAEIKPATLYERACAVAEKAIRIKPSQNIERELAQHIATAYMAVTPAGVLSLSALITVVLTALAVIGIFVGLGSGFGIFALLAAAGVGWYIYSYPALQARVALMRMSADTVLAILYMIIYMRISPVIEGGLRFAAQNLTGPLAWDLRKLMWDIEVGTYPSADVALLSYAEKWKAHNKEFAEALHLLHGSAVEPARREVIFRETMAVILNGTRERARHYAAGLRMPIMLLHAMGILLPVMGLVLFPIVVIFMAEAVKPVFLFLGYDVIIPAVLLFFMGYTLSTKPPTFSQPDISKVKGIPPLGHFAVGKLVLPIWPLALLMSVPLLLLAAVGFEHPDAAAAVNFSMAAIFGLALGVATYCALDARQKIKIRKDIERIEGEFSVALFQLGNLITGGMPIELAVDKASIALKDLKIADMFRIVSTNMRKFGMTFEQALFDKDIGAIWHYPSKLITSVMQVIIESAKKSTAAAADSMVTISKYLKDVHDVKEEMAEILGETLSSMKFLAVFLAPMVAGVTVTMAVIILQILTQMGGMLAELMAGGETTAAQNLMLVPWALGGVPPITPPGFQLIVGLYMIEMAIILSMFINRIEYGEDVIGERDTMSKIVLIAVVVYFMSWLAVYSLFGGPISGLLTVGMV